MSIKSQMAAALEEAAERIDEADPAAAAILMNWYCVCRNLGFGEPRRCDRRYRRLVRRLRRLPTKYFEAA